MFPVEIWEQILQHADPTDLVRLRSVCKCWNTIIPRIFEQTNMWYKKCRKDLPEKLWSSILEHQHHREVHWKSFHQAKDYPHVWMDLYRSWMAWCNLIHKTSTVETVTPVGDHRLYERITCIATLSNIIAIGTSEGYSIYLDAATYKCFKIDYKSFIQDIQLWRNGAEHMIVSSLDAANRVIHWNMNDSVVEHQSRASLMSASFQHCYMLRNDRLFVEQPNTENQGAPFTSLMENRYQIPISDEIVAIGGDGQEVILWSAGDCHFRLSMNLQQPLLTTDYYEEFEVHQPNIPIRYYRIFKPCVVGCVGELGEFGFSIDRRKWKIYNLFSKFHTTVTSILFHVALLVLGLGSGEVRMFAVKDIASLENLNFDMMKSKRLMLDSKPIIMLKVTEYNSNQYLVAASSRNVYIVNFD